MRQLGELDAIFLAMETPTTPAHIGGLSILDPSAHPDGQDALSFSDLREFMCERVRLCPRFGWKLQEVPFGFDLPYWVDFPEYTPEQHITRVAVPMPGGTPELADLVGFLYAKPLDRTRPLWEIFVIEGLQGGRMALLWKVHHCMMDGMSGAGLAELIFDLEPEPAPREVPASALEEAPGVPATWLDMSLVGIRNAARRPAAARKHLGRAARLVRDAIKDTPWRELDTAFAGASAPRASFNGTVGPRRAISWSSVSLDQVKDVKNELGVTVNDVVLALSGSAVRRMLESSESLPEESLKASVPVSTRAKGDAAINNQVREISVEWATNVADPIERVRTIHAAMSRAKQEVSDDKFDLLGVLAESVAPMTSSMFVRLADSAGENGPLPANAVVSNVPFAQVPLYVAGARVDQVMPISLLAPTQGLNVTVVSYCGEIHFGFTVDPGLVPNPWQLADAVPKALLELQEAMAEQA
jgi:WS/DGAT/MGAT family acyltransferase